MEVFSDCNDSFSNINSFNGIMFTLLDKHFVSFFCMDKPWNNSVLFVSHSSMI